MDPEQRRKIVAWVADCIVPHEIKVRAWLSRARMTQEDVDDVIQEAYCRLSALETVEHIERPDAYFFSIARNLLTAEMRRARIVSIEAVAEIEALAPFDEHPSPERQVAGQIELERLQRIINTLPDRCRKIFQLRKIEGLSQREIAARLGVTESIVENDGAKGMRLVLAAVRDQDRADADALERHTTAERPRQ